MSSDSESDPDIPDVKECQRLCEKFAEITDTDEACAQFYLQDRKWDLDISVNDFFEDRNNKGAVRVNDKKEAHVVVVVDGSSSGLAAAATAVLAESALGSASRHVNMKRASNATAESSMPDAKQSKSLLRFITWNVDGLCEKNLKLRTEAICKIIINEKADIVFLQEVVPESAEWFITILKEYNCLFGNEAGYFTGTFLKKSTISQKDFEIIDFPNTRMMRNALKVNVTYKNRNICLFNSHLESTVDGAEEREVQLKLMFKNVLNTCKEDTVIFGGDLNLRDKELSEWGGLPSGVEDLWVACGRRKECSYTWDMTRNDNLIFNGRFKPRCRFDRVYVRHSAPRQLKPVYFGLIGLERLHPHRCFPSDHWGILSHFDVE